MDIQAQKLELMQWLMNTQEKSVLEKVKEVFISSTNVPVAFDLSGNSLNHEAYIKSLDVTREEVRNGKSISLDDLEKESDSWK